MLVKLNDIIALCLIIAVTFLLSALGQGELNTTILIPFSFVYFFLTKKLKNLKIIVSQKPMRWYIFFGIITTTSILYAYNAEVAFNTQKKLIIVMLFSLAIFSYSLTSFKSIRVIYIANAIILFLLIAYVRTIGIDSTVSGRLDESSFNANSYGYYSFTGLSSLFLLHTITKKYYLKIILILAIVTASIGALIITTAAASRGGFTIVALLIIGNIYIINTASKKGFIKKGLMIFTLIIASYYLVAYYSQTYFKNSYLSQRFDSLEEGETTRNIHLQEAIKIGLENPFFGVGAGNYAFVPKTIEFGSFSHNSFAEVFANHGFTGLIVYSLFIIPFFKKIRDNLSRSGPKQKVINYQILFSLLIFLMYNLLYVVYLTPIFMHFLFAIYAHLLFIDNRLNLQKNIM